MSDIQITSVPGFLAGALNCGIKASGKPDLAMLVSENTATAAGVFTTNKIVGAPVIVGRKNIKRGRLIGCVTNSGCANVCTGKRGIADALRMCELTSECLAQRGILGDEKKILPLSTGIIGHYLPMENISEGIPRLVGEIGASAEHAEQFAHGILTTDTRPKRAAVRFHLGKTPVMMAGACKGSGMVAPNMATMLAYIVTDAAISRAVLHRAVKTVADQTFNCVSIDQHTSTSDTFVCMANGRAGNAPPLPDSTAYRDFTKALMAVADDMAQQIAADGEGATKMVTIEVIGARFASCARKAAMAIANSPLVKTAIHGGDPNWGRFISAAGYSGSGLNPDRARCWVGGIEVFRHGRPTDVPLEQIRQVMKEKRLTIRVDLGVSSLASAKVYTCDLSREYITINADYHT